MVSCPPFSLSVSARPTHAVVKSASAGSPVAGRGAIFSVIGAFFHTSPASAAVTGSMPITSWPAVGDAPLAELVAVEAEIGLERRQGEDARIPLDAEEIRAGDRVPAQPDVDRRAVGRLPRRRLDQRDDAGRRHLTRDPGVERGERAAAGPRRARDGQAAGERREIAGRRLQQLDLVVAGRVERRQRGDGRVDRGAGVGRPRLRRGARRGDLVALLLDEAVEQRDGIVARCRIGRGRAVRLLVEIDLLLDDLGQRAELAAVAAGDQALEPRLLGAQRRPLLDDRARRPAAVLEVVYRRLDARRRLGQRVLDQLGALGGVDLLDRDDVEAVLGGDRDALLRLQLECPGTRWRRGSGCRRSCPGGSSP